MNTMDERYAFVAGHADTHVILGSGEPIQPRGPLPRDAGVHLVAGKARLGGTSSVGVLPTGSEVRKWADLSPDHRWLGVDRDGAFALHDLHHGLRQGFSFLPPRCELKTIHPRGEMVAVRAGDEVQVLLPDGEVLKRATFPRKADKLNSEALTFSACGKYLWFAHVPAEGPHCLYLLRAPTLEMLDRAPVPYDPASHYDSPEAGWCELQAFVNPATGHVVLSRSAGDSFLSVSFLRARRGRIGDLHHVSTRDPRFRREPVGELTFSPDGRHFAGFDGGGLLYEWRWPECLVESRTAEHVLRGDRNDWVDLDGLAYCGDLLVVTMGRQPYLLRSGSLEQAGILPLCIMGLVLPNGMLLTEAGTDGDRWEVRELRVSRKEVPVVIELDSEIVLALRVMRRQKTGWEDIANQVSWVVPNFDVARGV